MPNPLTNAHHLASQLASERDGDAPICRNCKRYGGVRTFHTRAIWQDINGKDEPQRLPVCRVTVASHQGVRTVELWRYNAVDNSPQPCEFKPNLRGKVAGWLTWLTREGSEG